MPTGAYLGSQVRQYILTDWNQDNPPNTSIPMISQFRKFLGGQLHIARAQAAQKKAMKSRNSTSDARFARDKWADSLNDPTGYYLDCFQFFHHLAVPEVKEHRSFFAKAGRGFGEDAFHVMWWMLMEHFRPVTFLEIGVYRGQTLSLISLLQRRLSIDGAIVGISPFAPAGDGVTNYRDDIDYLADTFNNFDHFGLPAPELLKAYSTDNIAVKRIHETAWDSIYIDGNHDYEIAIQDWENCASSVRVGGIIILDDSALSTNYRPPAFATGGHPGPSRIASEIDSSRFTEILQVGHNRVFQRMA